jgi:hypothetical protein
VSLPPVFSVLSNTSAVTAIVGTSPVRVYPAGNIPQVAGANPNANLPCVSWQSLGGAPLNVLQGAAPANHPRVQIDCWATTFDAANALGDLVQAALESHGYCVSLNGHDYENETKRYRASFDFNFFVSR